MKHVDCIKFFSIQILDLSDTVILNVLMLEAEAIQTLRCKVNILNE